MKKQIAIFFVLALIFSTLIFTNGCRQPATPNAKVTVIDDKGAAVEGAMVIIKANNSDSAHTMVYFKDETKSIADTQYTTASGVIEYAFKYESILKVEVTKQPDRKHPQVRRGIGVLVLENDKTAEVTVEINEQTVFN